MFVYVSLFFSPSDLSLYLFFLQDSSVSHYKHNSRGLIMSQFFLPTHPAHPEKVINCALMHPLQDTIDH